MPEYYSKIEAFPTPPPKADFDPDDYSIWFERVATPPPPNKDVEDLRNDIEITLRVLRRQYRLDLDKFRREFNELVHAAVNGLLGETNIAGGRNDLVRIRNAIVDNAREARDSFIIRTLLSVLWPFGFGAVLFGITYQIGGDILKWGGPFALMHIGVAVGILLSALISARVPTFDQIALGFDQYGFKPLIRIIYVTVIAWALYILMATQLVILGITKSFNDQMLEHPAYGIIVGLICALADDAIMALIKVRVNAVVQAGSRQAS